MGCDRQLNVGVRQEQIIGKDGNVIIAVPRPLGDGNGWEWRCDRPLAVEGAIVRAIGRVGPGHGKRNIWVIVVILLLPCPYSFAIGGFW